MSAGLDDWAILLTCVFLTWALGCWWVIPAARNLWRRYYHPPVTVTVRVEHRSQVLRVFRTPYDWEKHP